MLLNSKTSALASRLGGEGASIGEVFTFLSSLYFRGKLTYATAFGAAPSGWSGALVITPGRGLVPSETIIRADDLRGMADVPVDPDEPRYVEPLLRDARALEGAIGADGGVVLLGSIATGKYVDPLLSVFGERLLFPPVFVGRGDMSRGGLLLRSVRARTPLEFAPVKGAVRSGPRAPKLDTLLRKKKPAPR